MSSKPSEHVTKPPRRTAQGRRAQRERATARVISHIIHASTALASHRGCAPGAHLATLAEQLEQGWSQKPSGGENPMVSEASGNPTNWVSEAFQTLLEDIDHPMPAAHPAARIAKPRPLALARPRQVRRASWSSGPAMVMATEASGDWSSGPLMVTATPASAVHASWSSGPAMVMATEASALPGDWSSGPLMVTATPAPAVHEKPSAEYSLPMPSVGRTVPALVQFFELSGQGGRVEVPMSIPTASAPSTDMPSQPAHNPTMGRLTRPSILTGPEGDDQTSQWYNDQFDPWTSDEEMF